MAYLQYQNLPDIGGGGHGGGLLNDNNKEDAGDGADGACNTIIIKTKLEESIPQLIVRTSSNDAYTYHFKDALVKFDDTTFNVMQLFLGGLSLDIDIESVCKYSLNPFELIFDNIYGKDVWITGTHIYYSHGSIQYEFNPETLKWNLKSWIGLSTFDGSNIWTDGTNIYYSNISKQYKLNETNSSWDKVDMFPVVGADIWTNGTNIFFSNGTQQYVFNKSNLIWSEKSWPAFHPDYGRDIWSDGVNTYFSSGTEQYKLVKVASLALLWKEQTWNGLDFFSGEDIWTDGTNIYYSSEIFSNQYILDKETSTWNLKVWNGLTNFDGSNIWTDGTNIYYSNGTQQYRLDKSTSTWVKIQGESVSSNAISYKMFKQNRENNILINKTNLKFGENLFNANYFNPNKSSENNKCLYFIENYDFYYNQGEYSISIDPDDQYLYIISAITGAGGGGGGGDTFFGVLDWAHGGGGGGGGSTILSVIKINCRAFGRNDPFTLDLELSNGNGGTAGINDSAPRDGTDGDSSYLALNYGQEKIVKILAPGGKGGKGGRGGENNPTFGKGGDLPTINVYQTPEKCSTYTLMKIKGGDGGNGLYTDYAASNGIGKDSEIVFNIESYDLISDLNKINIKTLKDAYGKGGIPSKDNAGGAGGGASFIGNGGSCTQLEQ